MFRSRKIVVRFIGLAIAFTCLGFTAFAAKTNAMPWCRLCDYNWNPGYIRYCSWTAPKCTPTPGPGSSSCDDFYTFCPLDVG